MDDSKLLQESNLAARCQSATSVIQVITSEELAQGPYVAARGGVKPANFNMEGTEHHHSANHAPLSGTELLVFLFIFVG